MDKNLTLTPKTHLKWWRDSVPSALCRRGIKSPKLTTVTFEVDCENCQLKMKNQERVRKIVAGFAALSGAPDK